mgnify:CR=1 FL=1
MPCQGAACDRKAGPWSVCQGHRGKGHIFQCLIVHRDQQIALQRRNSVRQRLACMARRVKAQLILQTRQTLAQHRDIRWPGIHRCTGPQGSMNRQAIPVGHHHKLYRHTPMDD